MARKQELTLAGKINVGFRKSIALIIFFALWQILPSAGIINSQFIPSISDILTTLVKLASTGELFTHVKASLSRAMEGFALAAVIGIPLGFLLGGWFKVLEELIDPLLQVLAQVNPFSLLPIFILFFGIGEVAKVAIIFWVSVWPILFSTINGVKSIDPLLVKAARAMSTPKLFLFWKVVLPGSASMIFSGIRSSVGSSFLMLVAAEMIGASAGLGWLVLNAQNNYQISRLFAAAFTIAVLGIALTKIINFIERRVITWKEDIAV
ncbi:ABC transporter permease [Clostridium sp. DJ247]|uniref:ABC transporter permease n=1 Tax=Clostridium sp. DJ247 TaxID=2726188 RepID=UPI001625D4AD|nr:ABC transporter permease [Clostridium sp. DJ247]MBC2580709.1 ABC transporter permease [Clostridium sp. DJ247]